jgi:protein SCO1/2
MHLFRLLILAGPLLAGTTGFAADIDHSAGHGAGTVHEAAATHPADAGHGAGTGHLPGAAHQAGPAFDEPAALARSQAAMGRQVGDYEFLDGEGRRVTLGALRGKPVVISLIYTSCYHICPTVTTNLSRVVRIAQEALGKDSFTVLTIGFDTPVDTPDRMREFGKQARDITNWHFVSASAEIMNRLSDDLGFLYFKSPKGFDHLIQATVLDAEGKVYRQIYGMAPDPPALVEPLKELLYGQPVAASPMKSLMNNIRLFCTVYDPTTGRYHFDYSLFVSIAIGLLTLGATAVFIVHAWRKHPPPGPAV